MTYLGSPPASQAFAPGTDTFNGDGTTVAFTLSRNVSTVNDIQVVVNNVVQQPTAYSVATSTLTFTAAPSAGTANIYVRYLSTNLVTIAPQQGSVAPSALSTGGPTWDTSGNVTATGNVTAAGNVLASSFTSVSTFGFKNRIINGAMVIDQRNASASFAAINNTYSLDRWICNSYNGSAVTGKFTIQQNAGSVTPPAGYINYLGITSSSASATTVNDIYTIHQRIEGLNVADLAWGTSSAATITISFWVRSSLTGTFGGAIQNSSQTRSYPFTYTISAANTWEQKSITIPGDTSGTWLTTNGTGLVLEFSLGAGSTYSGTANTWAGANYVSATGAAYVLTTNGATFYITGVQLEKGTTATSFDYRPYTTELQLCQRYYEKSCAIETAPTAGMAYDNNGSYVTANAFGTTNARTNSLYFKVQKRASPTVTIYRTNIVASNDNSIAYFNSGGAWVNYATAATMSTSQWGFAADFTTSGTSWGQALMTIFGWAATAEL